MLWHSRIIWIYQGRTVCPQVPTASSPSLRVKLKIKKSHSIYEYWKPKLDQHKFKIADTFKKVETKPGNLLKDCGEHSTGLWSISSSEFWSIIRRWGMWLDWNWEGLRLSWLRWAIRIVEQPQFIWSVWWSICRQQFSLN